MRHCTIESELGDLLVLADAGSVTGLYFPQHRYPPPDSALGDAVEARTDPVFSRVREQLAEYFAGGRRSFEVATGTTGAALAQRVWSRLRQIPYGETTTYGRIALELGDPHLAQAVGQAVGHNPISILIPCHRVVGANASLTGFAGGLARKRRLLEIEEPAHMAASRLF